jgi:release factor glutamine methyltransferase
VTLPSRARDKLETAARRLRSAGSTSPRLDAELLLAHVLGVSREAVLTHPEREIDASAAGSFEVLVERRARAEPMAYLLGQREFYGRVFKVDQRALIPRPETELLVDIGRAAVGSGLSRVVEVGTGSGAVAVSLAAETDCSLVATDVSWDALALARENARALGQAARVRFVQTDLLAGVRGPLEVVLANLPYIPSGRVLPPDVADYEPGVALYAGPAGTELLERLLRQARSLLADQFQVALELDECDQAQPMLALARALYPTARASICRDAGGYERVLLIQQTKRSAEGR